MLTKLPARLSLNFPLSDYVDAQGQPLPSLDDMRKYLDEARATKVARPLRQKQNKSSQFTGVCKRPQASSPMCEEYVCQGRYVQASRSRVSAYAPSQLASFVRHVLSWAAPTRQRRGALSLPP